MGCPLSFVTRKEEQGEDVSSLFGCDTRSTGICPCIGHNRHIANSVKRDGALTHMRVYEHSPCSLFLLPFAYPHFS